MSITIEDCDDGIGLIIESQGTVTDQELIIYKANLLGELTI